MTLKVTIFGAGAVGSVLAAQLARAGHQTSVIVRGAHLHALQKEGLRYSAAQENFLVRVAASDSAEHFGVQDVVIVAVKAQALATVAPLLRPLLAANTTVIFAQNGIPWWYFDAENSSNAMTNEVGLSRTVGCVVHCPCRIVSPGVVRVESTIPRFILGEPTGQLSPRLIFLQKQFSSTLNIEISHNLRAIIWQKLCINVPSSLLTTLTHSYLADIVVSPMLRATFLALVAETRAVAAAYGCSLPDNGEGILESVVQSRHMPSMLQDLLANRPLETDAQLGKVQQLAHAANVAIPHIDMLLPLLLQRSKATAHY